MCTGKARYAVGAPARSTAVESSSRGLVALLVVRTRFKTRCRARMTDRLGMGGACHARWTMRVCGYIDLHGEGAKCSWRPSTLHRCSESSSRGLVALLVVRTRFKTRFRARMTDRLGLDSVCHVRWAMWPADNIIFIRIAEHRLWARETPDGRHQGAMLTVDHDHHEVTCDPCGADGSPFFGIWRASFRMLIPVSFDLAMSWQGDLHPHLTRDGGQRGHAADGRSRSS